MSASIAAPTPMRRVRPPAKPRKRAPWRDPTGKVSALKIVTLILVILPGLYLALAWQQGALGARYVTEAERELGEWTIWLLLLSLAVTPARFVLEWPRVVLIRRMLGVTTACYVLIHLSIYALDQKWRIGVVASEIVLRFYLTIGFIAVCLLVAMALSSTDASMRRMGRSWKVLHRVIYFVAVLGLLHYLLQSKSDISAPTVAVGWFVWLMLWRVLPRSWRSRLWVLPLLGIAATLFTAGFEAAWYSIASHSDPMRVLAANLDVSYEFRPAVRVAIWGAAVFVVAALRRIYPLITRPRQAARSSLTPAAST